MEDITLIEQRNRLHPRKLMMWMAMASMFMVFAGLTSAFILQSGRGTCRKKWI
jgi:cytochrome c oxidase subunit 3